MSGVMRTRRARGYTGPGMRGDPGLFGFLGSVAKGVVKAVVPGGSAIVGAVDAIRGGGSPAAPRAPGPIAIPGGTRISAPAGYPSTPAAPSNGAAVDGSMRMNGKVIPQVACPSGYRPNKSGYFLKSGQWVAPGTKCVKVRRRNPLNPRALDRAMGRLSSAKKASAKIGRITIRKKKGCS